MATLDEAARLTDEESYQHLDYAAEGFDVVPYNVGVEGAQVYYVVTDTKLGIGVGSYPQLVQVDEAIAKYNDWVATQNPAPAANMTVDLPENKPAELNEVSAETKPQVEPEPPTVQRQTIGI